MPTNSAWIGERAAEKPFTPWVLLVEAVGANMGHLWRDMWTALSGPLFTNHLPWSRRGPLLSSNRGWCLFCSPPSSPMGR